jgi:hypothetical protein
MGRPLRCLPQLLPPPDLLPPSPRRLDLSTPASTPPLARCALHYSVTMTSTTSARWTTTSCLRLPHPLGQATTLSFVARPSRFPPREQQ